MKRSHALSVQCNTPGCTRRMRGDRLLCKPCWKAVPRRLRQAFYGARSLDEQRRLVRAILQYTRDYADAMPRKAGSAL